MLSLAKEPLSKFLAPLLTKDEGKSSQELLFDLSAIEDANPEQMTYLPPTVLTEFSHAIETFLAKASANNIKISDHERRLRLGFCLPDPDLEPDAYWLYGPVDDRKLVIIWGCEFKRNSSLPLTSDDPARPGVLEKLSLRKPSWNQTQEACLRLIREKQLPLAPFLASATTGPSGSVDGYVLKGQKLGTDSCQSLKKKLPPGFIADFANAAQAQLNLALPESPLSDYGKELIKAFLLPDPEAKKDAYKQTKESLFIVLNGQEKQSDCLHPTSDVRLNIPEPVTAKDGTRITPHTVVDKLNQKKAKSKRWLYVSSAAAALVVLILGVAAIIYGNPPRLQDVQIGIDPYQLTLVFNKAVADAALNNAPGHFEIQSDRGYFLGVESAAFVANSRDRKIAVVLDRPMQETGYTVTVKNISDRLGNTLAKPVHRPFDFRDISPLALNTVSAHPTHPNKLVLSFNKALDPRSVRPVHFQIAGFRVVDTELSEDQSTVILTTDERFEQGLMYSLRVEGLTDATANRNPLNMPSDMRFEFRDIIPPAVERVSANQNQVTVMVEFSKAVETTSAENPSNYRIQFKNDRGEIVTVPIRTLQLLPDNQTVIIYTLNPLSHGTAYTLEVSNILDRAIRPNEIIQTDPLPFTFRGTMDTSRPAFVSVRTEPGINTRVNIAFNKPITIESATNPDNFRIDTADSRVIAIQPTRRPNEFVLEVDPALPTSPSHRLSVTTLEDFLGNVLDRHIQSPAFAAEGPTVAQGNNLRELIEGAQAGPNGTVIVINFQEIADDWTIIPALASVKENYQLSHPVTIAAIRLEPEHAPTKITLELDPSTPLPRGRHTLTLRNMRLQDSPHTPEAPASVTFNF